MSHSLAQNASLIPLYRLLVISTLLALAGVCSYFLLPERKERILPDLANDHYLFFDGNSTMAEWIDERAFSFQCIHPKIVKGWPYCGLRFKVGSMPEGKDFSMYQRAEIKLHYEGDNQRLRVTLRNFNPAYSRIDDWDSLKGLDVFFTKEETQNVIVIHSYEWQVSEYWVRMNIIPRRLSYAEFNHIVDVSIDLMPPFAAGEHHIRIEYIDFYGELLPAENWYFAVAVLWLLTNLLFIARHLFQMQMRIKDDSNRLSSLASYSDNLKQQSQHYKELSTIDPLTGALNRNGLNEVMSLEFSEGKLDINTALILVDIDYFKKINDTWGHDVGDMVLGEVARAIRLCVLGSDKLIRWGGEEFILFCTKTNKSHALLVAEKVRDAIEKLPITHNKYTIPVTVSLGVSIASEKESFDEIFHRADQALYQAKHNGRNCVVLAQ